MLNDIGNRNWLIENSRSLISSIIRTAEHNVDDFHVAFECMISYISEQKNWIQIEEELRGRKVSKNCLIKLFYLPRFVCNNLPLFSYFLTTCFFQK